MQNTPALTAALRPCGLIEKTNAGLGQTYPCQQQKSSEGLRAGSC
jgi:hypothetical protein